MKGLTAIAGLLAAFLIAIVALAGADTRVDGSVPERTPGRLEMLETEQMMLERMRVGTSPVMITMIQEDPMWLDPEMIRAQEEYQAQLDRMLGKRPGQP